MKFLGEHQASETIRHPRLRLVKNEDKLFSLALRSLGSATCSSPNGTSKFLHTMVRVILYDDLPRTSNLGEQILIARNDKRY